jgi:hypothetical protein
MATIEVDDPCSCDSGRLARQCCMATGVPRPREADTRPPGAKTGYGHSRCYARALSDCSESISAEHIVSKNILETMAPDDFIYVTGLQWLKPGETRRISIRSMASNVLCTRHNNALSGVDVAAGRLFRKVRDLEGALRIGDGTRRVALFAGIDLERWILKSLMGLASARAARTSEGDALPWDPPAFWCRILFGEFGYPDTWGLYARGEIAHSFELEPGHVRLAPLTTNAAISGCALWLAGLELSLAMRDVPARRTGGIRDDSIRRPTELLFEDRPSGTAHSLCFAWSNKWQGERITIAWSGPREHPAANE